MGNAHEQLLRHHRHRRRPGRARLGVLPAARGLPLLVLDGGSQVGESWLRRWDSLRLFTPVRYNSLPGLPFPGEPYALPVKDDVARYLEAYVAHFALPVRLNTRVSSLVKDADRFVVMTDGDTFTARSVIVATGAYHRAYIPAFASDFFAEPRTAALERVSESRCVASGMCPGGRRGQLGGPDRAGTCRIGPLHLAVGARHGLHPPTTCLGAMCTTGCGGR